MKTKTRVAITAGAIRTELKKKFPEIKFSVTSENFAGGDAINISYNNGVPSDEIEKVTNKYEDGTFDGMIDLYEYKKNPENLPRAKYIMISRQIDEAIREQIKKKIAKKYGIEDSNDEEQWKEKTNRWSDQAVWNELKEMTF